MERQEKVIKGLESCKKCDCTECPYDTGRASCIGELMKEAFEVLKDLEYDNKRLSFYFSEHYPKCIYQYDGDVEEYCVLGPCSAYATVEEYKNDVERITLIKAEKALLGVFPKDADDVLFRNQNVKRIITRVITSLIDGTNEDKPPMAKRAEKYGEGVERPNEIYE